MKLHIIAPTGRTGYGVVGRNLLYELLRDHANDIVFTRLGDPSSGDPKDVIIGIEATQVPITEPADVHYLIQSELALAQYIPLIGSGIKVCQPTFELPVLKRETIETLNTYDHVFAPTQWQADVMVRNGVNNVHKVVNHGVDTNLFKPQKKLKRVSEKHPYRFVHCGKLEVRKSQVETCAAFLSVFGPNDFVELVLYCHNPFINDYNSFSSSLRSMCNNVSMLNKIRIETTHIPWRTWPDLLSCYDCAVLPTKAEGWGLPTLESMSCGLDVITSSVAGQSEYLPKSGLNLVPLNKKAKVPAIDNEFFFGDRGSWYLPDISAYAKEMKALYYRACTMRPTHNQIARDQALRYTWAVAARNVWDNLSLLCK